MNIFQNFIEGLKNKSIIHYIVYMFKMVSVSKITIFGRNMMGKSGIDFLFFFEIPPCGRLFSQDLYHNLQIHSH